MIKKIIIIIYSFFKKKFYRGNIDLTKENTWKSNRVAKKYSLLHNKEENLFFKNYISYFFTENIKQNQKVLDVGCGTGRLTKILFKKTSNVFGIDNSKEMIKFAPKRAKLTVGTAFNMPYEDNYFDHTVSMDLLLHFKNYKKIIYEMKRVVKKKGFITFNIGNKEHIDFGKKVLGKNLNMMLDYTGKSYVKPYYTAISNQKIKDIAKKHNLKVIKIIPYNFFQGNLLFTSFSKNEEIIKKLTSYLFNLNKNKIISNFFYDIEKNFVSKKDIKFTLYKIVILQKN